MTDIKGIVFSLNHHSVILAKTRLEETRIDLKTKLRYKESYRKADSSLVKEQGHFFRDKGIEWRWDKNK